MKRSELPDDVRAALSRYFAPFAAAAFPVVQPGVRFLPAPYLSLLTGKLQAMVDGEIQNLIVTLPPRGLKSFTVSVALPAFILGMDPSRQIMAVSYGQTLAETLGRDRLKLIRSQFFRNVFGDLIKGRGTPGRIETAERGGIFATSIDAAATGLGADWLIFDDPQKAQEALSDQVRSSINRKLEQTFLSRRNDPRTARIIIVMQRLHEDDFVGHALDLPGLQWDLLNLPAIAEEDEVHTYPTLSGRKAFRRKVGDILHPERASLAYLRSMEQNIGTALFATQYQQRPAPAGGGLVKADWFQRYAPADRPQDFDEVIQSWDTANTVSEYSDWTVCTTWGRLGESVYLLHVHRERLLFPDLVRAVRRLADRFDPTVVLIEDHASGTQLLQELRDKGFGKGKPIKPVGDKEIRMTNQTALIESGRVWIPSDCDWVRTYLNELVLFPNAKNDDQVDSTSQALAYLTAWFEGKGLMRFYKNEAVKSLPPSRLDWSWWRMRSEYEGVTFQCSSGDFCNGPDGWVWIPKPDAKIALGMGWEKLGEYEPPEHVRPRV